MSHKITLKELAAELNLSISTVSKALKNSYEINEKTIARVQALAKKRNYRPNRMALSLKSNKTMTIGVIIPNILNYFFSKVLLGIEEEANSNGYHIIICLSNNQYQKENKPSLRTHLFANNNKYNKLGSILPSITNLLLNNYITKKVLGIATQRSIPKLYKTTLRSNYFLFCRRN